MFSKAAKLYGRSGDFLTPHRTYYERAVYYFDLADVAATKARRSDLVWEYVTKKIDVLFKMGRFVEAASTADELLKRSKRADKREEALVLRRSGVRRIVEDNTTLPKEVGW